ncbi:DNA polymerase III subunit delta' [filamentous cyanobacterium LEGE 11480]|uniref:DNA polymerase III subunit delta n=1 Tax=Romeriopsis navalis LEGE 11480 TaxID=2777977 RepID=A0A928VKH9_9CYAN|nr:DNA polymerase III subunit delta' [Romeriopsis navalis]MBE9028286.1 DNA polymerase III subunit delta' [Romeriopsis navalis LEGE 11480]
MGGFERLVGQPQVVELLGQAMARDRLAPAYLFAGAAGVGRSLAAACFLQLLLGEDNDRRIVQRNHPDLLWVEPTYLDKGKRLTAAEASESGLKKRAAPIVRLEQVREISQFLSRPPLVAARSVVVIEAAESMPEAAANALLKTLEEPGQATIILLAPNVESLLPTLVSRCQRIPFYRLGLAEMTQVLQSAGHGDILSQPQVLALAQGSPGAAIEHAQRLATIPEELLQGLASLPPTLRQAMAMAKLVTKSLDSEAQIWLLDYLQQIYWQSGQVSTEVLQQLEQAKQQLRAYVQPQLVWEVMLMGAIGS